MVLYYNKNSKDKENLDIAFDESCCKFQEWDYDEIELENFDISTQVLKLVDNKIETGDRKPYEMSKEDILAKESMIYLSRKDFGQTFINETATKLDKFNLSDVIKKEVAEYLFKATSFLSNGWIETALIELNSLQPTSNVTQDFLNDLTSELDDFIKKSYKKNENK